jgi:hypothetical protein
MTSSNKKSRQTNKMEAGNNQTQNNHYKRQARPHPAAKTRSKGSEVSAASKQRKDE